MIVFFSTNTKVRGKFQLRVSKIFYDKTQKTAKNSIMPV